MILLDANVLIYASQPRSPFHEWAISTIADGVAGSGVGTNAVSIAEVGVGDQQPELVARRVRFWGVQIIDLPAAASVECAAAYRRYRERRRQQTGAVAPRVPLPDFFIGAHAHLEGWPLATGDPDRFRTYFPAVVLITPAGMTR